MLDGDDFKEANKVRNAGYSGGDQWRGTCHILLKRYVLRRILAATYVAMFADRVALTETLQQYKEDFSSLLQHMADCYKALFANKSSCVSASAAMTHPANGFKSIHALRKNINTVAMLTRDCIILEKGCTTEG